MAKNLATKTTSLPALPAPEGSQPAAPQRTRAPAPQRKRSSAPQRKRASAKEAGPSRARARAPGVRSGRAGEAALSIRLAADRPLTKVDATWPPGAWDPIRRGEVYCSPACGGGCAHRAYLLMIERTRHLAAQLGPAWVPQVYENLGWHGKVFVDGDAGCLSVHLPESTGGSGHFSAFLDDRPNFSAGGRWHASAPNAGQAIQAVMEQAIGERDRIQRALASVEKAFFPPAAGATARDRSGQRRGRRGGGSADARIEPIVRRPVPARPASAAGS